MARVSLLLVFAGATSVVVIAIAAVMVVASWWLMALAFASLLAMLAVVSLDVGVYLHDDGDAGD